MTEAEVLTKISKIEEDVRSLKNLIRSKERFLRSAGKWGDLDTEKLKRDIYDARKVSSRSRTVF